jgi:TPR repeat protein
MRRHPHMLCAVCLNPRSTLRPSITSPTIRSLLTYWCTLMFQRSSKLRRRSVPLSSCTQPSHLRASAVWLRPMRLDDIRLRDAARRGEAKACIDIAARYFKGGNGIAQNFQLGLAYLQQQLKEHNPSAVLLVGEAVPLEILIAQRCRPFLVEAARLGSPRACFKLGIWLMLRRADRNEGIQWIKLSERANKEWENQTFEDPREFAQILKMTATCDVVDRSEAALSGAHEALRERDIQDACYCISAAAELNSPDDRLAEAVSLAIQLAAVSHMELALPVDLVESCLWSRSEQGDVEAQYGLGCALGGFRYGLLRPKQLAKRAKPRHATALLLRAADAGKCDAWLKLSEMEPDHASSAASRKMSRFFLEKAADSGVLQAQRKLGALLLKEATSVERAEVGVHWLSQAAEKGDLDAAELLRTLILPLPQLSTEYETSVIEEIRAVSPELGARLALARALHLTRHETMTFNAKPNFRSWGLCMRGTTKENPKGRLVPAITQHMKSELQRALLFFNATSAVENTLVFQRSRTQRQIFKALSIPESLFFAKEIGRSWSHYGFGRHWATRVEPLLKVALG